MANEFYPLYVLLNSFKKKCWRLVFSEKLFLLSKSRLVYALFYQWNLKPFARRSKDFQINCHKVHWEKTGWSRVLFGYKWHLLHPFRPELLSNIGTVIRWVWFVFVVSVISYFVLLLFFIFILQITAHSFNLFTLAGFTQFSHLLTFYWYW